MKLMHAINVMTGSAEMNPELAAKISNVEKEV